MPQFCVQFLVYLLCIFNGDKLIYAQVSVINKEQSFPLSSGFAFLTGNSDDRQIQSLGH